MDTETATDLEARLLALQELGPGHEKELVAGFMKELDKEIDRRIDERLAKLPKQRSRNRGVREAELGIFVPIFLFAGIFGHGLGIAAAAAALAVVLVVQTLR
jgi:hypothetical protein